MFAMRYLPQNLNAVCQHKMGHLNKLSKSNSLLHAARADDPHQAWAECDRKSEGKQGKQPIRESPNCAGQSQSEHITPRGDAINLDTVTVGRQVLPIAG